MTYPFQFGFDFEVKVDFVCDSIFVAILGFILTMSLILIFIVIMVTFYLRPIKYGGTSTDHDTLMLVTFVFGFD